MKRFCKFLLAGAMISASALVVPLSQSNAQSSPEPAVVVSIADISQQIKDVDYLFEAAGFGQMKFLAQTTIKQYSKGMDTKTPAGVLLYFNEGSEVPEFLSFVPVSNIDDMLDTISGVAEVDQGDDFTTVVTDDGTEILIKQVGDLAFISNKKEMFENLPSNPQELLGELPTKYNLAAQVFGQRIPQSLRDQVMQGIRDGYEQQLQLLEEDEEGSAQAEMQRTNFEFQMKQFEKWFNETDNITMGMCADKDSKSLFMDVNFTALPGSDMGKRFAASESSEPSLFKGFLIDGAAFTHCARMNISPEDGADYDKMMGQMQKSVIQSIKDEGGMTEEDAKIAEKAVTDLLAVLQDTMAAGVFDSGAVLMMAEGDINFAAGVQVADPKKLEATVKELVAVLEDKLAGEVQVELNSGNHKDVTFHRVILEIPDDQEEVRDVVGDQLTLIIGIGKKSVYLSAGSNPLPLLKQAMDGTGTSEKSPMMQYNFYLTPILKFAAGIQAEPVVEKMAEALAEKGGDRINMVSKAIENGISMRFEMQDGILSLIKVGVENMGAGGFQAPADENDF